MTLFIVLPTSIVALIFGFLTSPIWIPTLAGLFIILKYTKVGKVADDWMYRNVWLKVFFGSKYTTAVWQYVYNWISARAGDDLAAMNLGYAILSNDGIYLENYKDSLYAL